MMRARLALFQRLAWRPLLRHPFLAVLNIFSIALGVAVYLAIQAANESASASFRAGIELVAGKAHLEVSGQFNDQLLKTIRQLPEVRAATPILEGVVTLPDHPGEYLRILGIDPFTGADLQNFTISQKDGENFNLEDWLATPGAAAISRTLAEQLGWQIDRPVAVLAGSRRTELIPKFYLNPEETNTATDPRYTAMDIGWAQILLGKSGELTSVQVLLHDPKNKSAAISAIQAILPPDAKVALPARRGEKVDIMLGAFQLNLTALSLVSMLVGMFLIYNTISASVVRRRQEIGILRALGTSPVQVRNIFLVEALILAFPGIALGLVAAVPLAEIISVPVSRTISSLYILTSLEALQVSPWHIMAAIALAVGATITAAWIPAWEAAQTDPAKVIRPGNLFGEASGLHWLRWLGGGVVLLGAAVACSVIGLSFRIGWLGFASAFFVLAGFSLFVPACSRALTRLTSLLPREQWVLFHLASQNFDRAGFRNAITIAALASAIAMTVGVGVMIHSFRGSVDEWVQDSLQADVFIAPSANEVAGLQQFVGKDALEWLKQQKGIREIGTFREQVIEMANRPASIAVISGAARGELQIQKGSPNPLEREGQVAVSESFANRFGKEPGDVLELPTPTGLKTFRIAATVSDFTRDAGLIFMSRADFTTHWQDDRIHSVALTLQDPEEGPSLAEAFRSRFGGGGEYSIYQNRELKKRVSEIFDQTFAVTSILRAIAITVAVVGVLLSLTTLVLERTREIGVLRALGSSSRQIRTLILSEAGLIGLCSSIVGTAAGCCLALVLTFVINKVFFGWSITLGYPVISILVIPLWVIPTALLASLWPAYLAGKILPARAVRFE